MIRKAIEADVIKVSRLWFEMVKELNPDYEPNLDWWREQTLVLIHNKNYNLFVADDGGKIVGFLDFLFQLEPSRGKKCAFARHYYVNPDYRHKTVARDLFAMAVKHAKEGGAFSYMFICGENEKEMWVKRECKQTEIIMEKQL